MAVDTGWFLLNFVRVWYNKLFMDEQIHGFEGDIIFDEDKRLVDEDGVEIELYDWDGNFINFAAAEHVVEEFEDPDGVNHPDEPDYQPETKSIRELVYVLKSLGIKEDLGGKKKPELIELYKQVNICRYTVQSSRSSTKKFEMT